MSSQLNPASTPQTSALIATVQTLKQASQGKNMTVAELTEIAIGSIASKSRPAAS